MVVRTLMPELRWLHHSPNGGKRDAFTGAQMRAMGTKKGWPDLILPVRSGRCPGLVIEMKSTIGKVSPEQREWLEHFSDQGWQIEVIRSAQDARTALCIYLDKNPDFMPDLDV